MSRQDQIWAAVFARVWCDTHKEAEAVSIMTPAIEVKLAALAERKADKAATAYATMMIEKG